MNLAPNTRLQRTGAAELAQAPYCWGKAFGGGRRPPLKRKPLGAVVTLVAYVLVAGPALGDSPPNLAGCYRFPARPLETPDGPSWRCSVHCDPGDSQSNPGGELMGDGELRGPCAVAGFSRRPNRGVLAARRKEWALLELDRWIYWCRDETSAQRRTFRGHCKNSLGFPATEPASFGVGR